VNSDVFTANVTVASLANYRTIHVKGEQSSEFHLLRTHSLLVINYDGLHNSSRKAALPFVFPIDRNSALEMYS